MAATNGPPQGARAAPLVRNLPFFECSINCQTCSGHTRPVPHLQFSPIVEDEQFYLISACKDGNPILRNGITGDWIGTFLGHKGAVWSAKLSHDAEKAVSASADFTVKFWDTYTGEALQTLSHEHIVRSVDISTSQHLIATGGHEKRLRIFDLQNGCKSTDVGRHESTIKSVVWDRMDPSDNTIITSGDDKKVIWWDVRSSAPAAEFTTDDMITSMEQGVDRGVITVTGGKTVHVFDSVSRKLVKAMKFDYDVSTVSIQPGFEKLVAGGSSDPWVRIHDYESGNQLELIKGHHGPVHCVSYAPNGCLFTTGSEDGTVRLHRETNDAYVNSSPRSADGRVFGTVSGDLMNE